jgi:hypothetical protein
MMKTKQDQYNEMLTKYRAGEISEEVWIEFCNEVLDEILSEPEVQAVLARLKAR